MLSWNILLLKNGIFHHTTQIIKYFLQDRQQIWKCSWVLPICPQRTLQQCKFKEWALIKLTSFTTLSSVVFTFSGVFLAANNSLHTQQWFLLISGMIAWICAMSPLHYPDCAAAQLVLTPIHFDTKFHLQLWNISNY